MVQAIRTGLSADEVATLLGEARELAEASGDVHTLAFVVHAAGWYRAYSGAPLDAVPLLEEAMALQDEAADVGLRIWTRAGLGEVYFLRGRLAEALTHSEEALALGRRDPHAGLDITGYRPYLFALAVHARTLSVLGRLAEAAGGLDQAIALAEQHGDWVPASFAHGRFAQLCDFTGDVPAAVAHCRAAVELAEKSGNLAARVLAFGALGLANVLDGQWREALDALGQALTVAREHRAGLHVEAQLLAHLARAQLGLDDAATARVSAEEAIAVAQRRGTRIFEIEAQIVLGRVLIHAGARREEVQVTLDAALSLVEETGAKIYLPFIHLERAALAGILRDGASRAPSLREAHRLFIEMGAPIRAEQVARELR
jgi:tetratricopeptide (TPR) repeat protein